MADPVPALTPFDVVSDRARLDQVVGKLLGVSWEQTVSDADALASALPLPDVPIQWDAGSPQIAAVQTAIATGKALLVIPWDAPADLMAGSLLCCYPSDPLLVVGLFPFGDRFSLVPSEPFSCTVQLVIGQSGF